MEIARDIKNTVLELINDLKQVFTQQSDKGDLLLVEFAMKKLSDTTIADKMVSCVLPHSIGIKNRDLEFFLQERNNLFAGLPQNKIDHFAKMISTKGRGGLSEEDINIVWDYFDTLLGLVEEYKKKK